MENRRCLYCYNSLSKEETEYHKTCSKKIFDTYVPPVLEYSNNQMLELAEKVVKSQSTVTGVQPKLSLGLKTMTDVDTPNKFTIMGVLGNYILKPPGNQFRNLPELEDLTMHLATISGIDTVPHTLIRLASGELAYLTRRIDRAGDQKLHMEDMCQLTGRLTEAKYRGSYEQIAKVIVAHSTHPGLDIITFFEVVVFSFLTGNNDMHLKNFSLFKNPGMGYVLSPAYDLVASELVVEGDDEELALNLNGKKKKLNRKDFHIAMRKFMKEKAMINLFERFKQAIPKWHAFIEISFLPDEMKEYYHSMIDAKAKQIEL